jgi:hypothetical protein
MVQIHLGDETYYCLERLALTRRHIALQLETSRQVQQVRIFNQGFPPQNPTPLNFLEVESWSKIQWQELHYTVLLVQVLRAHGQCMCALVLSLSVSSRLRAPLLSCFLWGLKIRSVPSCCLERAAPASLLVELRPLTGELTVPGAPAPCVMQRLGGNCRWSLVERGLWQ